MSQNVSLTEYVTNNLIPKCKTQFQLWTLQRRMQVAEKLHYRVHEGRIAKELGRSRRTIIRDKRWLEKNIPNFTQDLNKYIFTQQMKEPDVDLTVLLKLLRG